MSGQYGVPIMDSYDLAVIDAAIAYVDQLGTFNDITHPEVHTRRLQLAEAVGARFNKPSAQELEP